MMKSLLVFAIGAIVGGLTAWIALPQGLKHVYRSTTPIVVQYAPTRTTIGTLPPGTTFLSPQRLDRAADLGFAACVPMYVGDMTTAARMLRAGSYGSWNGIDPLVGMRPEDLPHEGQKVFK